jgi:DNA-binding transcriptional MerR regulator
MQTNYTITETARMAGITVRTLRYYEKLQLLRPVSRDKNGHRIYGHIELIRLQQILLYRKLGLELESIKKILDNPGFDLEKALLEHNQKLKGQVQQLQKLIVTVSRTILTLKGDQTMKDTELYEGLSSKEIIAINREVDQKYDPRIVAESRRRTSKMSQAQFAAIKAEGKLISENLSRLFLAKKATDDPEVQQWIGRHLAQIENFYPVTAEIFRGLGNLYTSDPRFRANYDKYAPGMADFIKAAQDIYATARWGKS